MALGDRRNALNPWPGYVDALSTLLMVIIFVLLVFVLAQAFLSVALTGRDRALDRLNRQVAELTDMLSLERGRTGELADSRWLGSIVTLQAATQRCREALARELAGASGRGQPGRTQADRDSASHRPRPPVERASCRCRAAIAIGSRPQRAAAGPRGRDGRTDGRGRATDGREH